MTLHVTEISTDRGVITYSCPVCGRLIEVGLSNNHFRVIRPGQAEVKHIYPAYFDDELLNALGMHPAQVRRRFGFNATLTWRH